MYTIVDVFDFRKFEFLFNGIYNNINLSSNQKEVRIFFRLILIGLRLTAKSPSSGFKKINIEYMKCEL